MIIETFHLNIDGELKHSNSNLGHYRWCDKLSNKQALLIMKIRSNWNHWILYNWNRINWNAKIIIIKKYDYPVSSWVLLIRRLHLVDILIPIKINLIVKLAKHHKEWIGPVNNLSNIKTQYNITWIDHFWN